MGSNALVTEGKEFAEQSLIVGAPAKVIRTLDEAMIARLRKTASTIKTIGSASPPASSGSI